MPLSAEKIAQLQALKNKPKVRRGGRAKSAIDTSIRTLETWFKLHHRFYDYETKEPLVCENPNCLDPRETGKGRMVVEVEGHYMCRYCFLGGYVVENPAQEQLAVE